MKAAAYIRVSTISQVDGHSLNAQDSMLRSVYSENSVRIGGGNQSGSTVRKANLLTLKPFPAGRSSGNSWMMPAKVTSMS